MERALRWRLVGLSRDEVVLKLGEPTAGIIYLRPDRSLEYILIPNRDRLLDRVTTRSLKRLVILLDEDGIVTSVFAGNPFSF
ncbi:MAG: hypothetical protein FWG66_08455 [Spirochaetes bacterium]|nr:hypothetical protein [Spirochaetota bacterium]